MIRFQSSSLFAVVFLLLLVGETQSTEVEYPATLPRPSRLYLDFFVPVLHYGSVSKHEASVVMYQLARIDETLWNCVAAFSENYLDATTKAAPVVRVPVEVGHTSRARGMCMIHAITVILPELIVDSVNPYRAHVSAHGIDPHLSTELAAVGACDGNAACLNNVAGQWDHSPRIMGAIVGHLIVLHSRSDGWNANGATDRHGQPCTANCVRYGDTTNYRPKNSPWEDDPATDGNWQPLLENDGNGFFFRQMHVTPHVGTRATPRVITDLASRVSPPPNYDYALEVELAIQRVRDLDDWGKIAVELLDNKIRLMIELHIRLAKQFRWTLEESVHFQLGYTFAQHDSVVVSWKEKIRYDMVRTTTAVHKLGDTEIDCWAGPYNGVRRFQAKHWQPYIRIMPHAEYPSGSSCICTVIQQYTDKYLLVSKNGAWFDPTPIRFAPGSSVVEPGLTPQQAVEIDFKNMTDVKVMCQDSRLWGGQHFTASPPGAEIACTGIGELAYDYVNELIPGSMKMGSDWEDEPGHDHKNEL